MQRRSRFLLLALSLLVAAVCIRLGVWQLHRLGERRTRNAEAAAQMALPPLDLLHGDRTVVPRYRRITARGTFDFAHEVALMARPRNGSPGVHIATPLVLAGTDTGVIVLRGWAYSADAATLEFARWREPDTTTITGYVLPFDADQPISDSSATIPQAVRRLDHARLERRVGHPLAGYFVLMTAGGGSRDSTPERFSDPKLDEGSHKSYAVQWFLFATIFGVGGTFVVLRRTAPREGGST